jgi:hypothetical protein
MNPDKFLLNSNTLTEGGSAIYKWIYVLNE